MREAAEGFDLKMNPRRFWIGAIMAAVCLCGACAQNPSDLRVQLESFDPAQRAQAAVTIADRGDDSLVPALVDRLDDEDAAVRFYVTLALERLTSTRLGYNYAAPPEQRRQAIERWRAYVEQRAASTEAAE